VRGDEIGFIEITADETEVNEEKRKRFQLISTRLSSREESRKMNMTREDCSRPSQRSLHQMTDKMLKQLGFVMMPRPEYVMNKTRTHCSRLSHRYRQLMTAQPDPRDRTSQHQDAAQMTTARMTPTPTV
jgi:hypothetical protein